MIDAIKKTVLAGIGAAVITSEKAQATFDEFVKQGKINGADAKAMAERIAERGKKEFEEASDKLAGKVNDLLDRGERTVHARIDELEARLAAMEEKHARHSRSEKS